MGDPGSTPLRVFQGSPTGGLVKNMFIVVLKKNKEQGPKVHLRVLRCVARRSGIKWALEINGMPPTLGRRLIFRFIF